MSNNLGPAAKLEAKANREHAKLAKARQELRTLRGIVDHSDLPGEIKLRLFAAIKSESDLIVADAQRLDGMRRAAQISRGPQWVTHSEDG